MIEHGSLIRSLSGRPAARNFHNFVINEIGHGIVTGKFPVGSVLANDTVMMEQYGVSRTVLREALKTLEAKGLVEARPKVGTRVSPRSRWNFFDPQVLTWHFYAEPDARFYGSLFRVRGTLEETAGELSARFRTAEHVRLMKYWLHQMATADDNLEQFGLACLEIHSVIAESSQNVLLRSVIGVVELTLALALTHETGLPGVTYRAQSAELYDGLIVALEKGEPERVVALLDQCRSLDQSQVI